MDGIALQAKVASALNRVGPMTRTALKRVTTETGGDQLIGRDGTIVTSDIVFNPQPVFTHVTAKQVLYSNNKLIADGDYRFLFAGGAVSSADLQDPNAVLVLRDSAGMEEILHIIDIQPSTFRGVDVALTVYAHPVER